MIAVQSIMRPTMAHGEVEGMCWLGDERGGVEVGSIVTNINMNVDCSSMSGDSSALQRQCES